MFRLKFRDNSNLLLPSILSANTAGATAQSPTLLPKREPHFCKRITDQGYLDFARRNNRPGTQMPNTNALILLRIFFL